MGQWARSDAWFLHDDWMICLRLNPILIDSEISRGVYQVFLSELIQRLYQSPATLSLLKMTSVVFNDSVVTLRLNPGDGRVLSRKLHTLLPWWNWGGLPSILPTDSRHPELRSALSHPHYIQCWWRTTSPSWDAGWRMRIFWRCPQVFFRWPHQTTPTGRFFTYTQMVENISPIFFPLQHLPDNAVAEILDGKLSVKIWWMSIKHSYPAVLMNQN